MRKAFFNSKEILAIFTDRKDGNLGLYVGNVEERVLENRRKLFGKLDVKKLTWMKQVHSDIVKMV